MHMEWLTNAIMPLPLRSQR